MKDSLFSSFNRVHLNKSAGIMALNVSWWLSLQKNYRFFNNLLKAFVCLETLSSFEWIQWYVLKKLVLWILCMQLHQNTYSLKVLWNSRWSSLTSIKGAKIISIRKRLYIQTRCYCNVKFKFIHLLPSWPFCC